MTTGYLYCISNKTIPDILRIGYADSPTDYVCRLNNAKIKYPTPFILEFTKKVKEPVQKVQALYDVLEHFTIRIHPDKDVFILEVREAKMVFDLIKGTEPPENTFIKKNKIKKNIIMSIVFIVLCVYGYYFTRFA
jgi:hypothetical protein